MVAMALLVFTVLTSGCGASGGSSPSTTVKAFYETANSGKYDEAKKFLSSEFLNALNGPIGAIGGGTRGILGQATRNGSIEQVEVMNEEIKGEGAVVHVKLHLKGGKIETDDTPLIKEKGVWKVTIDNDKSSSGMETPCEKKQSQAQQILNDIRQLDHAIDQWAIEKGQVNGSQIKMAEVAHYLKGEWPTHDRLGNPYIIGRIGANQIAINPATIAALAGCGFGWGTYGIEQSVFSGNQGVNQGHPVSELTTPTPPASRPHPPSATVKSAPHADAPSQPRLAEVTHYCYLGQDDCRRGDFEKAIADCSKAIELDATFARAYSLRGRAYCAKGDYDKAWGDVKQCQALGGTVPPDDLDKLRKASGRGE